MEKRKQKLDLLCTKCGRREAVCLSFWKTYHRESGRYSYSDPGILCYDCWRLFQGRETMFERQPVFITFNQIASMAQAKIGAILSGKGLESNQMSNEFWRAKVWRVWAYVSGKTSRIRKEVSHASTGYVP